MIEPDEDRATIALTGDESIILFELLQRWSDAKGEGETPAADCFASTAEAAVLNRMLGDLERQLVVPFMADYGTRLAAARERLRAHWDYPTLRG